MLSANLKAVYDEEFERAADNDRERTSFRVEPAVAYRPQEEMKMGECKKCGHGCHCSDSGACCGGQCDCNDCQCKKEEK